MPKEELRPSQWVVDAVTLTDAAGRFWREAGGALTTIAAVFTVGGVVVFCVARALELPPWAQIALGSTGTASIVYDPRKGNVQQNFTKPVENVSTSVMGPAATVTDTGAISTAPPHDDEDEWVSPQEVMRG
jgi:hypothetical protein